MHHRRPRQRGAVMQCENLRRLSHCNAAGNGRAPSESNTASLRISRVIQVDLRKSRVIECKAMHLVWDCSDSEFADVVERSVPPTIVSVQTMLWSI
jgi:hypothetical protein